MAVVVAIVLEGAVARGNLAQAVVNTATATKSAAKHFARNFVCERVGTCQHYVDHDSLAANTRPETPSKTGDGA
jgi:hypothetical protein